jgi:hypothetical protein
VKRKPSVIQAAVLSALAIQPAVWQAGPRGADCYVMLDTTAFGRGTLYGLQCNGWSQYQNGAVHITDAGRAALTEWRDSTLRGWGRTPAGYHRSDGKTAAPPSERVGEGREETAAPDSEYPLQPMVAATRT